MLKYTVPFFANTSDNTHCYQAALKSVLSYFLPDKQFTWQELEHMTAKKPNLWTWTAKALITVRQMGFEIIDMDGFDIEAFVKDGGTYLEKEYGKEYADAQVAHSDIPAEQANYAAYQALGIHQKVIPTLADIKKFLDKGYLLICNVNAKALNNKPGYEGHFVVMIGYDNTHLYLHDPGLPPQENRMVTVDQFMKAWEYPNQKTRNLTAFRYLQ